MHYNFPVQRACYFAGMGRPTFDFIWLGSVKQSNKANSEHCTASDLKMTPWYHRLLIKTLTVLLTADQVLVISPVKSLLSKINFQFCIL
jgi:hypothetical protein